MEYPQQPEEMASEMVKRFLFLFTGIFISKLEIILGKDKKMVNWCGVPNLLKMCVCGLKKNNFSAKIDKESPKCTEGGDGVTNLGKIPKIYQFFNPSLRERNNSYSGNAVSSEERCTKISLLPQY